ncbi:MAG: hypothetical protein DELT_00805 [Desulfovibrio sp.]
MQTHLIHFSATGTTETVVRAVGKELSLNATEHALLTTPLAPLSLGAGDIAVVGIPVYGGHVPKIAMKSIENLTGNGSYAVAVAVYGNREYDDALVELTAALQKQGFTIVGAAAFIGQHSIFPKVASGRPDAGDLAKAADFGRRCSEKIAAKTFPAITVKGKDPNATFSLSGGPMRPSADDGCTLCGACVAVCPVHCLSIREGKLEKEEEKCFACAACVAACPVGAQAFRGEVYEQRAAMFAQAFGARKEPEIFL